MNKTLENFARNWILENLKKCTVKQIKFYKRILNIKDKDISLETVVKKIPTARLDNDMGLIERTLKEEV